jgi:hypothetical protein
MRNFNKIAGNEVLKYMSAEFKELADEINQLHSHNYKNFRDNKRIVSDVNTLKIINHYLKAFRSNLDEYYLKSKALFDSFKKSIVKNDKASLVKIFGKDYMKYIDDILPGRDLASGYKYNALMELVNGDDRDLMEKALACIGKDLANYTDKYQEISGYFNDIFTGKKETSDYEWLSKYQDLFKFAKIPSFFNISHLFPGGGQQVEFGEPISLDIQLKEAERNMLKGICELFEYYKTNINKFLSLLDRAYTIDKGYMAVEDTRKEMLESTFDKIRALKHMLKSYIDDNGVEADFYDAIGLTFRNAFSTLDRYIYSLITVFPSSVSKEIAQKYLHKMPREHFPSDAPVWNETENKFFEAGKDYEAGERSGVEENGQDVLNFREKDVSTMVRKNRRPSWQFSPKSFVGADYDEALNIIKKSVNKK